MEEKNILELLNITEKGLRDAREKLNKGEDIKISPLGKSLDDLLTTVKEYPYLVKLSSDGVMTVFDRIVADLNEFRGVACEYLTLLKQNYIRQSSY